MTPDTDPVVIHEYDITWPERFKPQRRRDQHYGCFAVGLHGHGAYALLGLLILAIGVRQQRCVT